MKYLASTKLTVVLLCLLAVLVVWGTLYQAEHGLYAAQQRFYQSYVFLVMGVIPFPGTQLVMLVLFFNLLSAMFVSLRYRWKKAGSVLTHAGLLVLLAGGYVIQLYARESSLTLEEGEGSNVASAYHDWEIAVWEPADTPPTGTPPRRSRRVTAVSCNTLTPGSAAVLGDLGVRLEVETYFRNAVPLGAADDEAGPPPVNAAGIRSLRAAPLEKEPSANLPGGIFRVRGGDGAEQRLLLAAAGGEPTRLAVGGKTFEFSLQRQRQPLPFTVVLNDFQREMHPGSGMARSFASEVTVLAGETSRRVRIAMNEPLRYRGFTLYQSSYREMGGGREFSTLAVVRNHGRYLPYAGSLIVFVGLLVHFVTAIYERRAKVS